MPILNNLGLTSYNFSINNGAASTVAPELVFNKARSLSGSPVVSGDRLGRIYFGGADSTSTLSIKLGIEAISTGTIGPDRIPFNLRFYTAQDAPSAPQVIRMAIGSDGVTVVNQSDNDTGTVGTPTATFSTIGSSIISYNRSITTAGGLATIAKSSGPGVSIISGDEIGYLTWDGFTGAGFGRGAQIKSVSTGTISAGNVPANLSFWTKPDSATAITQRMVITSSGLVDIAQSEADTGTVGTTDSTLTVFGSSVIAINTQNNTNGAYTSLIKNRALGPIVSGDTLGTFAFIGADSASQEFIGSYISSTSTGTIAAGKIPANLTFATRSNATNSLSPRMSISDGGNVEIFTPNSGTALKVDGSLDILSIENVFGVTPAGATEMVIINASGELGSQAIPGSALSYTAVNTSPYVVLVGDQFLGVDCSGGAITIQLPNAPTTGRYITIKDSTGSASTNNITVTTVGGVVTIDGATSYVMSADYESVSVLFNSTSYEIY